MARRSPVTREVLALDRAREEQLLHLRVFRKLTVTDPESAERSP
jgi:hypothetical protein